MAQGIKALFPIQAQTFNVVFEGKDLIGRARTGQVMAGPSAAAGADDTPPGPENVHQLSRVSSAAATPRSQGKTLAFVLPIIESLGSAPPTSRPAPGSAWQNRGKQASPRVIVLAPTRELAKQARGGRRKDSSLPSLLAASRLLILVPFEPSSRKDRSVQSDASSNSNRFSRTLRSTAARSACSPSASTEGSSPVQKPLPPMPTLLPHTSLCPPKSQCAT